MLVSERRKSQFQIGPHPRPLSRKRERGGACAGEGGMMITVRTLRKRLQVSALLGLKIATVIAVRGFVVAAARGNLSLTFAGLIIGVSMVGGSIIDAMGYFSIKSNGRR